MKLKDFDISKDEAERLIDQWIFSERDRMIIKRRLLDEIRFEPLAEEFGLSVRHTKTIVCRCSNKIFSKIK